MLHNILIYKQPETNVSIDLFVLKQHFALTYVNNTHEACNVLAHKKIALMLFLLDSVDISIVETVQMLNTHLKKNDIPLFLIAHTYDTHVIEPLLKEHVKEFFTAPLLPPILLSKINFWIALQKKKQEEVYTQKLLHEYKDAVDHSVIVSKTDTKGLITFANEKFCQMSGYPLYELLGKSHNIVRHPDMPSHVFAELWKEILQGKSWRGIVKNKRKDVSAYWVNSMIYPIIDINGEIVEFISIRTDITELQEMKEHLRDQLKISENNFEAVYHRSKQYEEAINESTILSRTDLEGKITYANHRFYTITGYDEGDIIGQTHKCLHHPDTPKKVISSMWKTIKEGRVWKGILKNWRKDKIPFWTDTTIFPIQDKAGKIVEYMAIRNDITEIITLYKEIEATQEEVIYRMGEIVESRSKETHNHVRRVVEYSKLLALKCGIDNKEAQLIASASAMHDIGKVGISDAILLKPSSLNEEEWAIMHTHCLLGYNVLASSERPLFKAAAIIAKEHHEKYNGKGYPNKLSGNTIHLYARIVAIADVFDALSSDRTYKKAWPLEKIIALFKEERGEHFDPFLVDLFLKHVDEFVAIQELYADTSAPQTHPIS